MLLKKQSGMRVALGIQGFSQWSVVSGQWLLARDLGMRNAG